MEQTADIALIGLAVMGQNLIMNMNDHGYTVVAFNRKPWSPWTGARSRRR